MERYSADAVSRFLRGEDPGERAVARESGIDCYWDVLARLLEGGEPSSPHALSGDPQLVDEEEGEFYSVKIRDSAMTREITEQLARVVDEELERRYLEADFTGVYSSPGTPTASGFSHTLHAFHLLKDFYTAAAEGGDGVVFWLA
jgi:hypothetical protein